MGPPSGFSLNLSFLNSLMAFSAIGFLLILWTRPSSILIPSLKRVEPTSRDSLDRVANPGAGSTWMVVPPSGRRSSTIETTADRRVLAVSSSITLVMVNWESFSRRRRTSCKSALITSAEKLPPRTGVSCVDSAKTSLGSCCRETQVVQLLATSSIILAMAGV